MNKTKNRKNISQQSSSDIPQEVLMLDLIKSYKSVEYFDIGASHSQATQYLYANIFKKNNVFINAFEPSSSCYREIAARYGFYKKLKIHNIALGEKKQEKMLRNIDIQPGFSTFVDFNQDDFRTLKKHHDNFISEGAKTIWEKAEIVKLDSFFEGAQINKLDIMKIDTEGWEEQVLQGSEKIINKYRPVMFIELHSEKTYSALKRILAMFPEYDFMKLSHRNGFGEKFYYYVFYDKTLKSKIESKIRRLSKTNYADFYSSQEFKKDPVEFLEKISPKNSFYHIKKTVKQKQKEKNNSVNISKTFCILPWIHLSTRPNGHLRCCCTACASSAGPVVKDPEIGYLKNPNGRPANLNTCDLLSAWNNDYMKSIRLSMLKGDIPGSCQKCFKEEKAGFRSKRMWETKSWSEKIDIQALVKSTKKDGSIAPQISYVDLRLGSKCDLKCIMCSPHDSSIWITDWMRLYPKIKSKRLKQIMKWDNYGRVDDASYDWYKNNKIFWNQFYEQIPNLKQLYFAGGEPLIIEKHYEILRECVKQGYAKNMELRYNSNGLNLSDELLELWKKFKKVKFGFSLDTVDEMNYYIRYPSDWNTIVKNLRILDETPDNVEVTIACAVQILNILYIPEFIKWKLSMNFKKINTWPVGAGLINSHFVYHPAHLNVKVLPGYFKDKVKEKFEKFYSWLEYEHRDNNEFMHHPYGIERLRSMVDFMYSEDWSSLMPEFKEYILRMDNIRGTRFDKTFPEMKSLLK